MEHDPRKIHKVEAEPKPMLFDAIVDARLGLASKLSCHRRDIDFECVPGGCRRQQAAVYVIRTKPTLTARNRCRGLQIRNL